MLDAPGGKGEPVLSLAGRPAVQFQRDYVYSAVFPLAPGVPETREPLGRLPLSVHHGGLRGPFCLQSRQLPLGGARLLRATVPGVPADRFQCSAAAPRVPFLLSQRKGTPAGPLEVADWSACALCAGASVRGVGVRRAGWPTPGFSGRPSIPPGVPGAHGCRGDRLRPDLVGFPPPRRRSALPESAALVIAALWRLAGRLPGRAEGRLGRRTGADTAAVLRIRHHVLRRAAHLFRRSHQEGSVHFLLPAPSGGVFPGCRALPAAPLVGHTDRRPGLGASRLTDRAFGALGSAETVGLAGPAFPGPALPSGSGQ